MTTPVIVVVFNRPEYTRACLDALYGHGDPDFHGASIQPIIVNNGSRKATEAMLAEWVASYKPEMAGKIERPIVLSCDKNSGFAGGVNKGMKWVLEASAIATSWSPHICILHNDAIVSRNWLGKMIEVMSDEDTAVVMPRTNYANEQSMCIPEIRQAFLAIKPSNKERLAPEEIQGIIQKLYPDGMTPAAASTLKFNYSPEIASFCMLIRSGLIEKYGMFDEDFWPRGYEDKFWYLRPERDGWICSIANEAYVHHFGNITSDGPGFSHPDIMAVNGKKFAEKAKASLWERK